MPLLTKMVNFWRNLFRRREVERDLNDELHAWLEEMAERKIQAGLIPELAHEAALLELGGMDRVRDLVRQQRVGFRELRRAGVIAVVAIFAFVSGIGATLVVMKQNIPPIGEAPMKKTPSLSEAIRLIRSEHKPVLRGRIVDDATGKPVPDVEIGMNPSPEIRRFTYTDPDGYFEFINPPAGYQLTAGDAHWRIGQPYVRSSADFPLGNDYFELTMPTKIAMKDKSGRPLEGDPVPFFSYVPVGGKLSERPAPPTFQRFRYSSSVMELRTANLLPGNQRAAK